MRMTGTIVDLGDRRPPVRYTVHLTQGYDGSLAVEVVGTQDDPRSRRAVADALRRSADLIENSVG